MATLAASFTGTDGGAARAWAHHRVRGEQLTRVKSDPNALRALPYDNIFFYCKRIDNSRLVRQANPQAKGECWSAIGAVCMLAVLLSTIMGPSVGIILSGYKAQSLKEEQQHLVNERRILQMEEADLLNIGQMDKQAKQRQLGTPEAGQLLHLQPRGDGAVAQAFTRR